LLVKLARVIIWAVRRPLGSKQSLRVRLFDWWFLEGAAVTLGVV